MTEWNRITRNPKTWPPTDRPIRILESWRGTNGKKRHYTTAEAKDIAETLVLFTTDDGNGHAENLDRFIAAGWYWAEVTDVPEPEVEE